MPSLRLPRSPLQRRPRSEEKAQPNLVGYGAAPRGTSRPQRRARGAASPTAVSDTAVLEAAPHDAIQVSGDVDVPVERPRSTPPVRQFAKQLGVDLVLVEGTGAAGLITRSDVEAYAERVGATSAASMPVVETSRAVPAPGERTTRTPIRGVRKHTAEAMVRSAFTAPHVTTFLTVDVTATSELIASLKGDRALAGPQDRDHGRRREGRLPGARAHARSQLEMG